MAHVGQEPRAAAVDEDVAAEAIGNRLHCERTVIGGAEPAVVVALGADQHWGNRGKFGDGEAEAAGQAAVAQRLLQPDPAVGGEEVVGGGEVVHWSVPCYGPTTLQYVREQSKNY